MSGKGAARVRPAAGISTALRHMISWVWALLPLVFGLPAAVCFAYAAARGRSRWLAAEAVGYAALSTLYVALVAPDGSRFADLGIAIAMLSAFVATIRAVMLRRRVFGLDPLGVLAQQRTDALRIVHDDAEEAVYLRIGRTDVPTSERMPDAGLIDMNNVPAEALAESTGIDLKVARRIVAERAKLGGFSSLDEMSTLLDLPPRLFDAVDQRLVFLPMLGAAGAWEE